MNPSTALATVVVDELVRQGVRHVVLCPGSRSAPFAYAVLAAERAGRLTMHVRVDERSAGFLAVGLAKLTRVPAVVVTTSGTAVANLHPAVLEAHHGVVPLVVLSADRPVELRGTGANQTTTQPGMFADAVRWSADLPAPAGGGTEQAAADAAGWRAAARDAVAAATGTGNHAGLRAGGEPGPVHLNVQLREPLVPADGPTWPGPLGTAAGEPSAPPHAPATASSGPTPDPPSPDPDTAHGVPRVDPSPARTLVLVGDLPEPGQFERAVRWATSHGWPVLAEPFGPHPRDGVLPHGHLVLADPDWLDDHAPERVVTVGRLTLSRPFAALLRRPGTRVEAVGTHAWVRSGPSVAEVHPVGVLDELGPDADAHGADPGAPAEWAEQWRRAAERVAVALDGAEPAWPSGGAVARTVLEALPGGATLFLGSSSSVRDVDVASGRAREGSITVVASRGLAGIDGCVSTASGLALAGAGPAYALMGDLTFLHDANGLLVGPLERGPDLTLVVVNDDGGGIFALLEPGAPDLADDFERVFGTPTGTDLAALCAAHGVRHVTAGDAAELAGLLAAEPRGTTVVEVRLDRARHRAESARLAALARDAVRAGGL